jgi:hypothetical protein
MDDSSLGTCSVLREDQAASFPAVNVGGRLLVSGEFFYEVLGLRYSCYSSTAIFEFDGVRKQSFIGE